MTKSNSFADALLPRRFNGLSARGLLRRWLLRFAENLVLITNKSIAMAIFGGPVFFQTVRTACQLDLFGLLNKKPGLTRQEIAAHLNIDEYPTRILLLTCVALRLIRKSGNRYRCRWPASMFLDNSSPRSIVAPLEWMHHIVYPSMFYYFDSVTQCRAAGLEVFDGDEDNLYARLSHNPHLEEVFHEAMQTRSRVTNIEFVRTIKFSKFNRILDVGGGNGENLSTIAKFHPHVSGTLVDFPSVATRAAERFLDEGLDDRLKAVGANILEDNFPKGHNCIIFCHLTSIFSEQTNRNFMKKAYEALDSGGMACIYAPFTNNNESGPLLPALLSPYFLCTVNGQGRNYSWVETASWLKDAGFINVTWAKLIRDDGVVLGFKGHQNHSFFI